jgi:hypothetical protein
MNVLCKLGTEYDGQEEVRDTDTLVDGELQLSVEMKLAERAIIFRHFRS